jgi:acetyl esterase/lipase
LERVLYRFSVRILVYGPTIADQLSRRLGIEQDRMTTIGEGPDPRSTCSAPQKMARVLREVGQRGASWTFTSEGERPLVLPQRTEPRLGYAEDLIIERGKFRPDRSVRRVAMPTITVFVPPASRATGAGVIICPGGGYAGVTIDKEGYDVARRLADTGITGIVLKYSLPRPDITWGGLPWPFEDLARAQQIVRERAREWDIDPARLGVMGFSAGGHLAAGAASEEGSTLAFAAVIYPCDHDGAPPDACRLAIQAARPSSRSRAGPALLV